MAKDIVFDFIIDGKQGTATLKGLQDELNKTKKAGGDAFKGISLNSIKAVGAIGGVAVALKEIIDIAYEVSKVLASVYKDVIDRGLELNATFETSGKVLGQALGDPELGQAAVKVIDELAEKFRANKGDAQQFAQSILPRSDSLETFSELLRLVDIQADTTGKSFDELGFSIREALSGDFVSLRDQFDVSKDQVERIKALTPEIGASAALAKVLGDEFERLGKTDISGGTFAGSLKDLQIAYDNFAERVGEPVFDELKEQINAVLSAISNNQEGINRFADALGDLAAAAARLVGSELEDLINSLDFAAIEGGIDNITRLVNAISALIDIALYGFRSGALQIAFGISTGQASIAGAGFVKALTGEYESLGDVLSRISAEQAQLESDLQQSISERGATEEAVSEDVKNRINEELASKEALKGINQELADSTEDIARAQDKYNDALDKREENAAASLRRLAELEIRQGEARTEAALRQAEDRIQAENDESRAREAILFKFNQDIARLNLDDGTARISRENAKQRADVDRDLANERISIERNYQQEIRRIQQSFSQSAQEAAINVDAQAFRQAQTQRDNDLATAGTNRQNQLDEAKQSANQQREALKAELENEIADAKEAHQKKLADLRLRLDQELEAQAFKAEQDRQRQAELDAIEDERLSRRQEQERARFDRQEAEKLLRLNESLSDQVKALFDAKQQEIEIMKQAEKAKADIQIAEAKRVAAALPIIQKPPNSTQSLLDALPIVEKQQHQPGFGTSNRRALGGPVSAGQSYLVGERGPELFRPSTSGNIVPNNQLFSPAASIFGGGGNSTTNNNTINAGFTPEIFDSPEMKFAMDRAIDAAMQRMLGQ